MISSREYSEVFREVSYGQPQLRRKTPSPKKVINSIYKSPLLSTRLESYSRAIHSWRAKHESGSEDASPGICKSLDKYGEMIRLQDKFPNFFMNQAKTLDLGSTQSNILKDLDDKYMKSVKDYNPGPFHLKSYSVGIPRQSPIQQKSDRFNESRIERKSHGKLQDYLQRRESIIQEYYQGTSREGAIGNMRSRPSSGAGVELQLSVVKVGSVKEAPKQVRLKRASSAAIKVNSKGTNNAVEVAKFLKEINKETQQTENSNINSMRIPTDHSREEPLFHNMILQQISQTNKGNNNHSSYHNNNSNGGENSTGNKKFGKFICSWSQITGRKEALKKLPIKVRDEKEETGDQQSDA